MHNPQVSGKFNIIYSRNIFNRYSCRNFWCWLRFFTGRNIYYLDFNGYLNQSKCDLEKI